MNDKQSALDLYKPPFKLEYGVWAVSDANGYEICGVTSKSDGELIAEALNEYWEKHK
jgi:hypothetical protein